MGDLYFTVISASYQSTNRISRFNVHIHNCIAVVNCCTSTGPTDQTTCKATAGGSLDFSICIAGLNIYRIIILPPYISNQTPCRFNLIRSICSFDCSTDVTIFYRQRTIYITNQDADSRPIAGSFNHRIFYGQILNFTIRRNCSKQSHINFADRIQASNHMSASIKFSSGIRNRSKLVTAHINIAHQFRFPV